jgi:hypothetical protein
MLAQPPCYPASRQRIEMRHRSNEPPKLSLGGALREAAARAAERLRVHLRANPEACDLLERIIDRLDEAALAGWAAPVGCHQMPIDRR